MHLNLHTPVNTLSGGDDETSRHFIRWVIGTLPLSFQPLMDESEPPTDVEIEIDTSLSTVVPTGSSQRKYQLIKYSCTKRLQPA